jgi:hypothetical protein
MPTKQVEKPISDIYSYDKQIQRIGKKKFSEKVK